MVLFARVLSLVVGLLLAPRRSGARLGRSADRSAPLPESIAVLKVLEDPELKKEGKEKERRAVVRQIANEIFDFSETARRSLARHWAGRTQAEREEFVELFSDLLERSYISKIELYGGEKIQFVGEAVDGEGRSCAPRSSPSRGRRSPSTIGCTVGATSGSSTTSSSRV